MKLPSGPRGFNQLSPNFVVLLFFLLKKGRANDKVKIVDRHQEEEDVGEMEITIANCKKNIILNNCRLLLGKQHKEMKAEDHNHCCKVVF